MLRSAGYEVIEVTTGGAALRAAPGVDLMVLDINLPDIDGFEVCRRLREDPRTAQIPVLHLSATFTQARRAGLRGGRGQLSDAAGRAAGVCWPRSERCFSRVTRTSARRRRRLRTMFKLAPVAIAILDESSSMKSVNPAFCALTGCTPAELVGKSRGEA